ncbi:putative ABC transport system permease protein [Loktanella fryxellensis]|uniref:Putative ABC transport system permease protein n=1 Tax=Loktanella fryxellensis TaxID=245187 RepID=A0A1H8J1R6_9RHOB|nr:FtsX-like permease family protein [Loktanella fryxellensis]SEN74833.1 putative ABC transport system permease protein [Loktanella fryxellensis]
MTRTVFSALLSHWWRNPLQLFTLLAGLALATALWSGVQAINAEAAASYDAAAATLGEGSYDQLTRSDGQPMDQATYVALRRAGWLVSPVVEGRLDGVRIVGLDPLTAPGGLGPVEVTEGADIGQFLSGQGQVFGRADALAALPDGPAQVDSPDVAPGTVITDIGVAQRLLDRPGQIDRLIVAPVQPVTQAPLDTIAPDLTRQVAQSGSDVGRLTDSFHLNLTAFGLLSFAVGIFIVNGAIGLAFEQRRPVVRTLRALGVPLRRLMVLMAAELAVLALVAGAVGVALGYVVASLLLPDVAATLQGLYGATVSGELQLRPSWWLSGLGVALGGTAMAAAAAFWRLAHLPLLAGAAPRALTMAAGRSARVQGALAAVLLVAAGVLALTAGSLTAGFALLATLLIGAALALPLILDRVLALAERLSTGVRARWFWADTRQQLPGLSLALAALLLAMAANVGVSTMVSSFRLTFTGFLDQRLASELYVTAEDAAQADALQTWLAPRVRAVLPIQSAPAEVAGLPTEVFGARDDATYRDNWALLSSSPDAWDAVAGGTAILINEQLSRRSGLAVGDVVPLVGRDFTIVGVYGDYGNPIGQVFMTEDAFLTLYPDVTPLQFGLRLPSAGVPALQQALADDVGLPPTAVIDQAGIKQFSLDVFNRTFTVTTALNILTLTVAGFAILMSLLTLAALRVPQLAPAWAMGLTRRELGLLELIRAVLLAVLTAAVALPLGLALAWALLAIVNVAAFGWRLPMFLFPLDYLRLGGFALVAAALAALWPAWRLARTPPADLLKVFSNER